MGHRITYVITSIIIRQALTRLWSRHIQCADRQANPLSGKRRSGTRLSAGLWDLRYIGWSRQGTPSSLDFNSIASQSLRESAIALSICTVRLKLSTNITQKRQEMRNLSNYTSLCADRDLLHSRSKTIIWYTTS